MKKTLLTQTGVMGMQGVKKLKPISNKAPTNKASVNKYHAKKGKMY